MPPLVPAEEDATTPAATAFYQLLAFKGDANLEAKVAKWERFYNLVRLHGAHRGAVFKERLSSRSDGQAPA